MTDELKKQCNTIINIFKTQTPSNKALGDQYILGIFNNLEDSEKIYVLKCIVECSECLMRENLDPDTNAKIYDNIKTSTQEETSNKVITQEIDDIEEYNKKELIRLKVWGIKVIVLIGLLISSVIILSTIILGAGVVHTTNRFISEVQAILGYLSN
jgi:hypothetical protein